jgi:hypothetical protein
MGNNKGKWDSFYAELTDRDHYIDSDSYRVGASYLSDCEIVEDWGCGKGWFGLVAKEFDLDVVGVDGSQTPFANKVVDLEDYTTQVDGIFMRSVAEHNFEWKKILENLVQSFTKKAFVQFYTPMNFDSNEGILLQLSPGYDNIPEISIPVSVWENILLKNNVTWVREFVDSPLAWGEETYYFLSK